MEPLLFFITPTEIIQEAGAYKKCLYTALRVFDDGKVNWRYQKFFDENAHLHDRTTSLNKAALGKLTTILIDNQNKIKGYAKSHKIQEEAKPIEHSYIKIGEAEMILPDFVFDLDDKVYLNRYKYFPDPEPLKMYLLLREIISIVYNGLDQRKTLPQWQRHVK